MSHLQTTNPNESIFESIKKFDDKNHEYWLARELMSVLEYIEWRNFEKIIRKGIDVIKRTYPHTSDHFVEVNKKIKVGAGTGKEATREIKDYRLSRRACYLIAQNGDSRKKAIALAQNYFAQQTRKQELREIKDKDELLNIRNTIINNQGSSKIRIYYGSIAETFVTERDIQINPDVINAMRQYMVITDENP